MVITANVSSPLHSDVRERTPPGTVDHEVVYLVCIPFVGRLPGQLCEYHCVKRVSLRRQGRKFCAEFHQPRSISPCR